MKKKQKGKGFITKGYKFSLVGKIIKSRKRR